MFTALVIVSLALIASLIGLWHVLGVAEKRAANMDYAACRLRTVKFELMARDMVSTVDAVSDIIYALESCNEEVE